MKQGEVQPLTGGQKMKYTKEERLEIGRQVYEGQFTRYQAAEKYGISDQTARDYMRMYRDTNSLPQQLLCVEKQAFTSVRKNNAVYTPCGIIQRISS